MKYWMTPILWEPKLKIAILTLATYLAMC